MESQQRRRAVVVGSGLAGLECALGLREAGWAVEVLSPGRPGHDGATHRVHALAPWVLLTAPWVRGDGPRRFLADLVRRGEGLGRDGLAEALADEAHDAACRLIDELDLERLGTQPALLPGDEVPRGMRCLPRGGSVLLAPLLARCRRNGVVLTGRKLAMGLLVGAGRAAGVVAVDRVTGAWQRYPADAVVLACGGTGAVFPVATAPRWCRGSGLAIAAAAGVLLHRPELTQALPVTATRPLYFPTSAALVAGTIRVAGDAPLRAPDLDAATRVIAGALHAGAPVYLDPAEAGEAVLPERVRRSPVFRAEGRVRLALALHHAVGGVAIDAWGRTSLPGVYACGEAAGGVQGRRRTMGTGLLEATIFARRAVAAMRRDAVPAVHPSAVDALAPALPLDPARLEQRLDALMGPLVALRRADGVGEALRELTQWPVQEAGDAEEGAAMAALRLRAAVEILAAERRHAPGAREPRSPRRRGIAAGRDAMA